MYIFNVTFNIDDTIIDEGLSFFKQRYIPEAIKKGMLFNPRLCYIYPSHEDDEGKSYSIQFYVKSEAILEEWKQTIGQPLHQEIVDRFRKGVIGFVTLMEELDLDI